ncbi:MAG: uroporphyrinogen decarboxylase/cobalamine-independent methonine synthase family protein [Planctomycetota bacterium]|jgi:uroporphyrinogen decarboxylase
MNTRELFNAIMHYGDFDRMPVMHWKTWDETHARWLAEGLPEGKSEHEFLGASPMSAGGGVNLGLLPDFGWEEIEDRGASHVVRQHDGVIAEHWKDKSCIPHFIDYTLKGGRSGEGWDEYKERLRPDPARIPADLDERIGRAKASALPIAVGTGSMIGWIRNWMGVENLAFTCYENRELLAEMVMAIADLVCWQLDIILEKVTPDIGWGWEDICFRTGPLVGPEVFAEVAVPGYRKISQKLLDAGCDLHLTDCDGMIDALVPHWLEGGVNVMFPIEIGAWGADPAEFRRRFGKELRIFGGIDKLALARGRGEIDAEIARRVPLMKEGGFVPLPDHLIQPEVPLADYRYYLEEIGKLRF